MARRFNPGDKVKLTQRSASGIHLMETTIIGFNDIHENPWGKRESKLSGDIRYVRIPLSERQREPRYIVEHFHGWFPTSQDGFINPNFKLVMELESTESGVILPEAFKEKLVIGRRYNYAYDSWLEPYEDTRT